MLGLLFEEKKEVSERVSHGVSFLKRELPQNGRIKHSLDA
jgi:hypothetical protein